jgi:hypothetical protein
LTDSTRKPILDDVAESDGQRIAIAAELVRAEAARFAVALPAPGTPVPLTAVARAKDLARAAEQALRATVDGARAAGRTWQELGDVLGTSRQAAFQRFGRPIDPRTGAQMAQAMLPDATERALVLLGHIVAGRWTEAGAGLTEQVSERLGPAGLPAVWARVLGSVGAYELTGEPFARQLGDFTVVDVPLSFEAGELTGRFSFTPAGQVGGLFFVNPEATS